MTGTGHEAENGRVATHTLAHTEASYAFSYTVDGAGNVTQTEVINPRGYAKRFAFNSDHYMTSLTEAYGTAPARTTNSTRASGSNFVTAMTDGLDRETDYTYDSSRHVARSDRRRHRCRDAYHVGVGAPVDPLAISPFGSFYCEPLATTGVNRRNRVAVRPRALRAEKLTPHLTRGGRSRPTVRCHIARLR